MNMGLTTLALLLAVAIGGFAIGYLLNRYLASSRLRSVEERANSLLAEAQTKQKETVLAAQEEALRIRRQAEEEIRRREADLRSQEERLHRRRESIERRLEPIEAKERELQRWEKDLARGREELEELRRQRLEELEKVASLSQEEAKKALLESVEKDVRQDAARMIREIELETKEQADGLAREIITMAIQRCASDQVAETTVSVVPLPSDDMKGRIIGRGGRNIRALENALRVDLIVDDTPEAVTISGFDSVRREIARVALTKLIMDGRIHPARIEKVAEDSRKEVEAIILEEGQRAAYEVGLPGLQPELIRLLGRLKYRTSYGQNQLIHAIETARLAAIMAAELGANVEVAKEAGLLHDIGKAMDHEIEGPHALIGADVARRFGKSSLLVNAIAAHHHEEEPQSVEAILVEAADAISGARPGARRESLESYIKRIQALEEVANSFPGVAESYAIQAGREIRIIVKPEDVDDLTAIRLAKDVAKKVEESLEYPGQIKVTVIRETRAVDYAK